MEINRRHVYGVVDSLLITTVSEYLDVRKPDQPIQVYQPHVYIDAGRKRVADYINRAFTNMGRVIPHGQQWFWVPNGSVNAWRFLREVKGNIHDRLPQADLMAEFYENKNLHRFAQGQELSHRRQLEEEMSYALWLLNGTANKKLHIPSVEELAGRLDVSGMVNITLSKRKPAGLIVSLRGAHTGTLEGLKFDYEGSNVLPKRVSKHTGEPSHQWTAGGQVAVRVLEDILPYMVFRKEVVELLLEYNEKKGFISHGRPRSPEATAERDRIYQHRWSFVQRLHELRRLDRAA